MWELFCFRKPYLDEDPVKLPYAVALHNLRPPLAPHIPQPFVVLMTECWSPDSDSRPDFMQICARMHEFTVEKTIDVDEAVDVTKVGNDLYKLAHHHELDLPGTAGGNDNDEGESEQQDA
ncbi:hypothetical protein TeGR_g11275 [Tetraparma gracilis]|jgi:hypothetical protein|uniref:Serine-threonine/tyrosine-protein kinase catalytic domain-containing protein n=1 Tax=Tetraparma gracilis TaxID=2962635 RepID=A0ABQ6MYI9_9STRA|nr:hypothetical protein TeGR_g11275 [Tetraparma gracilis]